MRWVNWERYTAVMRITLSSLLNLLLMSALLGGLLRAPCGVATTPSSSYRGTVIATEAPTPCPMHHAKSAHPAPDIGHSVPRHDCDHSGSDICHCQAVSLALIDLKPISLPELRPQGIRPRLQSFVFPRLVERRLRPPIARA